MPKRKKKALFIVPPSGYKAAPGWDEVAAMPLEGVSIAATVVKNMPEWDVDCYDLRVQTLDSESLIEQIAKGDYSIVCIAGTPDGYTFIRNFTEKLKETIGNCNFPKVLVGGPLANHSKKVLLQRTKVDYCFHGECETKLPHAIDCIINPNLSCAELPLFEKHTDLLKKIKNCPVILDDFDCPDYKSLWGPCYGSKFPRKIGYSTQRGCPYNCIFCANPYRTPRTKSKERIKTDIKSLKDQGFKEIWLNDPTFNTDINHCRQVIEILKDEGLTWACTMRPDKNLSNSDLLNEMHQAGCNRVFLGIESACQKLLNNSRKGTTLDAIKSCLEKAKQAQMPIVGFILLGLPQESLLTLKMTENLCKSRLFIPRPHYAVPFPGSKLCDEFLRTNPEMKEEQILEEISNLRYDGTDTPMRMPNMKVPTYLIQAAMFRLIYQAVKLEEEIQTNFLSIQDGDRFTQQP